MEVLMGTYGKIICKRLPEGKPTTTSTGQDIVSYNSLINICDREHQLLGTSVNSYPPFRFQRPKFRSFLDVVVT